MKDQKLAIIINRKEVRKIGLKFFSENYKIITVISHWPSLPVFKLCLSVKNKQANEHLKCKIDIKIYDLCAIKPILCYPILSNINLLFLKNFSWHNFNKKISDSISGNVS